MLDIKALEAISRSLAGVVHEHVGKAFGQLSARLDAIDKRIDAIPAGPQGERGDPGEKGEPGARGEKGDKGDPGHAGPQGERGADGRDGDPGKDGRDGIDGKSLTVDDIRPLLDAEVTRWALEFERRAQDTLQRAIDRMPVPKDGKDGKDGRDGLGVDDMQIEFDGRKTLTFQFVNGDLTRQFDVTIPVVVDCGIYKDGQAYTPGDGVTWGGSYWIAQRDTTAKPDGPDSGWRLAVKRGRDGKDGRDGIDKTAPVSLK